MRRQKGQQWETLRSKWNCPPSTMSLAPFAWIHIYRWKVSFPLTMCTSTVNASTSLQTNPRKFVRQCMELPSNVHLQHVYIHHLQKYLNEELLSALCTWYKQAYSYSGSDDNDDQCFVKPTASGLSKQVCDQGNWTVLKGCFTQYARDSAAVGGRETLFPMKHFRSESNKYSKRSWFTRHNWATSNSEESPYRSCRAWLQ